MSDRAQRGSHQEEAQYYYDFATERNVDVPESVSSHIRQCPSCCRQIVRLKEAVFGAQNRASRQHSPMNRDVIEMLDSHFRCLDEQVVCSRVRPFLPGLLQPSLKLRIPTPITVHVDQCPQCAKDLDALRKLALDSEQLERLHWLYERKPSGNLVLCWRARSSIAAFSRGCLGGIAGEILKHLSTCPRCRADVYARRQMVLDEWSGVSDDDCDGIAPADLLDYVVPCGDMIRRAGRPEASHVGTCRRCLETIQALHRTLYGVIDGPASGVTTVYHTIGDSETVVASPGDPYADHPITVRVMRQEPQRSAASSQFSARAGIAAKRPAVNPHVRRLLKTAVAAAALIPLAALFLYTQGASGVTLAKVFRAFGQVRNVRVMGLNPDTDRVTYELWVARDLKLAGLMRADGCVVYDLAGKRKADVGSGDIVAVDDVEQANVARMANHCLGFTLADIPPDAAWDRLSGGGKREVYELSWMDRTYGGREVALKYEVAIDKATLLPESLRMFREDSTAAGWKCTSVIVFEYPADAEATSFISGKLFSGAGRRR